MTPDKNDITQNRGEAAWTSLSDDFTGEIAERIGRLLAGVLPELTVVPGAGIRIPTVFLPNLEFGTKYQDWADKFISGLYLPPNVIPWLNDEPDFWQPPVSFTWFDPMWWRLMLMQGRVGSLWSETTDDSIVEVPFSSASKDFFDSEMNFPEKDKYFEATIDTPRRIYRRGLPLKHPMLPILYNSIAASRLLPSSHNKNATFLSSAGERPSPRLFANRPATPAYSFIETIIQRAEPPGRRIFSIPSLSYYVPVKSSIKPSDSDFTIGSTGFDKPEIFPEIDRGAFHESLLYLDTNSSEHSDQPTETFYLPGAAGLRMPALESISALLDKMTPMVVPDGFLSGRKGVIPSLSQSVPSSLSNRIKDIRSDLDSTESFPVELETIDGGKDKADINANANTNTGANAVVAPYASDARAVQRYYTPGQDETQDEDVLFNSDSELIVSRSFQNFITSSQNILSQQALIGQVPMDLLRIVAGGDTAAAAAGRQTRSASSGTSGLYRSTGVELALAPIARSTRSADNANQSDATGGEDSTARSEEEVESVVDAEQLAMEVYDILKRRLLIERERAQAAA